MDRAKRNKPGAQLNAAPDAADWLLEAAVPRPGFLSLARRWVFRVFSGRVALAAVLVTVAAGWLASSYHGWQPLRTAANDVMVAALVYLLLWLFVIFIRSLPDMLSEAVAYLVVCLLVISLPLLVIPAYRRWVIRQFRDKKHRGPTHGD